MKVGHADQGRKERIRILEQASFQKSPFQTVSLFRILYLTALLTNQSFFGTLHLSSRPNKRIMILEMVLLSTHVYIICCGYEIKGLKLGRSR
jgi:hypothetical protein